MKDEIQIMLSLCLTILLESDNKYEPDYFSWADFIKANKN